MGKIKKLQDKGATILPLTVADAVLMNSRADGTLTDYLAKIKDDIAFFSSLFGEDSNGDVYVKSKNGIPRGFYSYGFISAGGADTASGGTSGSGADLSAVWQSLSTANDAFADREINVAHIPILPTTKIADFSNEVAALVAGKADKATTLAGYGITDALGKNATAANSSKLGGMVADDFQHTIYAYYTNAGENDTTTLPNIFARTFDGVDTFKFYDTKFYASRSASANRAQVAYGYYKDAIHFRRYFGGKWHDWKEVAFKDFVEEGFFKLSGGTLSGIMNVAQSIDAVYTTGAKRSFIRVYDEGNGIHYDALSYNPNTLDIILGGDNHDGDIVLNPGYGMIRIGDCRIWYDEVNECLRFSKGIASDSFVSTKGVDNNV